MSESRPNILFLYADQHRADALGCAGNDVVATPNLDRLAAEGLRCTNTWTESPICQPARASILTGRFPTDHGILGNFVGDCEPEWDTVPRAIQASGYDTASIGKTHYASWPQSPDGRLDTPPPPDEWVGSFGFDHVVEEFDRYIHVGKHITPYMQFLLDHDALEPYSDAIRARYRLTDRHWEAATSPIPQELDLTSFLAGEAERWLKGRTGDRPWFLQLSFVQPHVPLMGDPEWAAYYADAAIARKAPSIPDSDHEGWAQHLEIMRRHARSELLTDDFVLAGARQYYAMISLIDQKIGELLNGLEERGELDNTTIVYSADHGEMLGDHGLMAKMNFYRSSVRVPLIVRPPGGGEARVYDGPVQGIDMVGHMLDVAGTSLADVPARTLAPLSEGASEHREAAVSMIRVRPGMSTWLGVTDGQTRATFDHGSGEIVEHFDLASDPDEADNRASSVPAAEVDRLRELSLATLAGR